jgi:predicted NAD/FAD-binding protein
MSSIAVIGTGISGMGAAWLLNKKHQIAVYEKSTEIGGHTRTRIVKYRDKTIPVDTGFIVFNHQNYPNLCALFKHLDVPTHKSDMTFSLSVNGGEMEWGAKNLNAVFGQRSNLLRPQFYGFIADILRFNRLAVGTVDRQPQLTLGQLLETLRMGKWFTQYYILPMGGAIWSCPLHTMLSFPAYNFVHFFKKHGLLSTSGQPQWHTVTGGSIEYVKRLTAPFAGAIRTNCAVTDVKRRNGKVLVTDQHGDTKEYDHVVFACHGDQALAMLKDANEAERAALTPFRYQKNVAYLHKDTAIMPKRKLCWASWVYHYQRGDTRDVIPVTYWMNLLQGIDNDYPLFVTLNPLAPIPDEHVFDKHVFEHPIYSQQSVAAQGKIASMQGQQNTWFCGAHLRNGFHEDGLASAVVVAKGLGSEAPWA